MATILYKYKWLRVDQFRIVEGDPEGREEYGYKRNLNGYWGFHTVEEAEEALAQWYVDNDTDEFTLVKIAYAVE